MYTWTMIITFQNITGEIPFQSVNNSNIKVLEILYYKCTIVFATSLVC